MIALIRQGFGFKTDLFETNILNLRVVLVITVNFVGDALRVLLNQRREIILSVIKEIDQKARRIQNQLEDARKAVETARLRSQEIRMQTIQTIEQENFRIQQQLKEDLYRLQETSRQGTQIERQRIVHSLAQQVANITLTIVENNLVITFGSQEPTLSKQKELNDIHVRETFRQLKR